MSIFGTLGEGDIWSISGISFASPVNDILEKEQFTLEELLVEDELLQEVKSKNANLIKFLCDEVIVEKMVHYIVTPPPEGADDLRVYKYPYMSTEVFCCEVPRLLEILVESNDSKYLNMLFSILDQQPPLNQYLAGYFEKTLEMLFRRMTVPMMSYLNTRGMNLLHAFLNHIENYSIMQIFQRVMLPHIPFSVAGPEQESMTEEELLAARCDWSYQPETCFLLCQKLISEDNPNVPSHISDMLITVLQLSPPDAQFLVSLCEPQCLSILLSASFREDAEMNAVNEQPSIGATISLAAIAVLESLLLRFCESLNVYNYATNSKDISQEDALYIERFTYESIEKVAAPLAEYIPTLERHLSVYLTQHPCGHFNAQNNTTYLRLGARGLQLVKFTEAIMRLAHDKLDEIVLSTRILNICVDLMFTYELNSLLHLSVQRIILVIVDNCHQVPQMASHILINCNLVYQVMRIVKESNVYMREHGGRGRKPVLSHVLCIAQTMMMILQGQSTTDLLNDSGDGRKSDVSKHMSDIEVCASALRDILVTGGVMEEWEAFVEDELQYTLGGQMAPVPLSEIKTVAETSPDLTSIREMESAMGVLGMMDAHKNFDDDDDEDDDFHEARDELDDANHGHFISSGSSDSDEEDHMRATQPFAVDFENAVVMDTSFFGEANFAEFGTPAATSTEMFPSSSNDPFGTFADPFADFGAAAPATDFFGSDSSNPSENSNSEPQNDPFADDN